MIFVGLILLSLETIEPDARITFASGISRTDQFFYIYDGYQETFFQLNRAGEILRSLSQTGQGPGELGRPVGFRIVDDQVWIFDLLKRSVMVYDLGFNFVKAFKTSFLVRDALPLRRDIQLVGFDPEKTTMLHRMNSEQKVLSSFGSALEDKKLLGFQSGKVLLHDNMILFVHTFQPAVFVYSESGSFVTRIALPGFSEPFVSKDILYGKGGDLQYTMSHLFIWESEPYLKFEKVETKEAWFYPIEIASKTLGQRLRVPYHSLPDHTGRVYIAHYDQDGELVKLTQHMEEIP